MLVLALGPVRVEAHDHALATTKANTAAAPADEQAFDRLYDEMNDAGKAGDWDTFLDRAEGALAALPERKATHVKRQELIGLVGSWKLDARNEAQLRRSAEILAAYQAELQKTYGSSAEQQRGWDVAGDGREAIRAKLSAASPAAGAESPSNPPPEARAEKRPLAAADRSARASTALVAAGGATTGVGAILLLVGLGLTGRWAKENDQYESLRLQQQQSMNVPEDVENAAYRELVKAEARALGPMLTGLVLVGAGVALLVVGLRNRRARTAPVALAPRGLQIRF